MAVIRPAAAVVPLDTPKARARGRATAATVITPSNLVRIFVGCSL